MSRQNQCLNPICANLGLKPIRNLTGALKLQDRFKDLEVEPPDTRRQRIDPEIELQEARSMLSDLEIKKNKG